MAKEDQDLDDFSNLLGFVMVVGILEQRNKDILNPVVVDTPKLLQDMIGIEHISGWERS